MPRQMPKHVKAHVRENVRTCPRQHANPCHAECLWICLIKLFGFKTQSWWPYILECRALQIWSLLQRIRSPFKRSFFRTWAGPLSSGIWQWSSFAHTARNMSFLKPSCLICKRPTFGLRRRNTLRMTALSPNPCNLEDQWEFGRAGWQRVCDVCACPISTWFFVGSPTTTSCVAFFVKQGRARRITSHRRAIDRPST